jgi:WD40 repeat protein
VQEKSSKLEWKLAYKLVGHMNEVLDIVCIGIQKEFLLSGSWDGKCKLWNLQRRNCIKTYSGGEDMICNLLVMRSNAFISVDESYIKLWNLYTGDSCDIEFEEKQGQVYHLPKLSMNRLLLTETSKKLSIWQY